MKIYVTHRKSKGVSQVANRIQIAGPVVVFWWSSGGLWQTGILSQTLFMISLVSYYIYPDNLMILMVYKWKHWEVRMFSPGPFPGSYRVVSIRVGTRNHQNHQDHENPLKSIACLCRSLFSAHTWTIRTIHQECISLARFGMAAHFIRLSLDFHRLSLDLCSFQKKKPDRRPRLRNWTHLLPKIDGPK